MKTWTIDFTDLKNTIDEMLDKLEDKPKAEQSSQSDLTAKYKKLYEASVNLETLKYRREALEKAIVKIDLEIEELNKLFSN
jgi:predicted  nucleic acid-binding Zn-ribbon protein